MSGRASSSSGGCPALSPNAVSTSLASTPQRVTEVGAYLQHRYDCGIILYNVRPPGGKLAGLNELDVIGLNLPAKQAFLCEVTTHLHGMRPQMVVKMPEKHRQQKLYANAHLQGFAVRYQI